MSLKNQHVVITGASSGIGAATAKLLAKNGVIIHAQGRNEERLKTLSQSIQAESGEITTYALELTNDVELVKFAESLDKVDVVIHSAGVVTLANVEDSDMADFDKQYQVNLRTPFYLTKELLPKLKESKGQLVFINSGAGLKAHASWAQYAATKHGLKALADGLREEVKQDGIRVISIYPGRTATPMQEDVKAMEKEAYEAETYIQVNDVAHQVMTSIDLARTAVTKDVVIDRA